MIDIKKKVARIIERTACDGGVEFVIQQRHFLFKWWWVDAWLNSYSGASCKDYFSTLKEAKENMCYFDGTECKERVVG